MLTHLPESDGAHNHGAAKTREVSTSKEKPFSETETLTEVTVAEEVESDVFHPGDPFAEFCDIIIETEDNNTGGHGCGYCAENFEVEDELIQHIFNHHNT